MTNEREERMQALVEKWGVVQGQIWEISGRMTHYAYCGDARDEAVGYIFEQTPVGLFTSPSYLAQRDYDKKGGRKGMAQDWTGLVSSVAAQILPRMDDAAQVFFNIGPVHKDGRCLRYWEDFLDYVEESLGWPLLAWNVWDKAHSIPGNHYGRFAPRHEWLFHFARHGVGPDKIAPSKNAGKPGKTSRKFAPGEVYGNGGWTATVAEVAQFKIPDSVVQIPVPGGFREKDPGAAAAQLHPARYPIELPAFHMRAYKALLPCGPWVDPFAGSFTTLLAGEREGVQTYMVESEPRYFAAALERCELEGLGPTLMYRDVAGSARPTSSIGELFL